MKEIVLCFAMRYVIKGTILYLNNIINYNPQNYFQKTCLIRKKSLEIFIYTYVYDTNRGCVAFQR